MKIRKLLRKGITAGLIGINSLMPANSQTLDDLILQKSDFDWDGVVDYKDFLQFALFFDSPCSKYDLNENKQVDFPDFTLFASSFNKSLPVDNSPLESTGGLQYLWWNFESDVFPSLDIGITIYNEPTTKDGLYFQLYQGKINNIGFYFGLQTDVFKPGVGSTGKGFIFSRWESKDPKDAKPSEDGWIEAADHEGGFVGVRAPFDWKPGFYRFKLQKHEQDDRGEWYSIEGGISQEKMEVLGALRFPFPNQGRPGIHDSGATWTEIYYKAEKQTPIPFWHVSINYILADDFPLHVYLDYSSISNTDIVFDDCPKRYHLLMGPHIRRSNEGKKWISYEHN